MSDLAKRVFILIIKLHPKTDRTSKNNKFVYYLPCQTNQCNKLFLLYYVSINDVAGRCPTEFLMFWTCPVPVSRPNLFKIIVQITNDKITKKTLNHYISVNIIFYYF